MKVLCVNKFFHIRGGADKYFFETMKILEDNGHEVIPFSTTHSKNRLSPYDGYFSDIGGTEDDLSSMGILKKSQRFFNGIYSFEAAKKIEVLIKDTNPDIAHVHNILYQLTPSIFPVLQKHNVPVVQSLHDWHIVCGGGYLYTDGERCERCKGGKFYQCTLNRCYRDDLISSFMASLSKYVDKMLHLWDSHVDAYTVPSIHMANRLRSWGINPDKIFTIPNPFFSMDDLNPTYVVDDYVLWYGRLLPQKGIMTVLRTAKQIPSLRFELYGSGPEEGSVRCFIKEHNLENVFLDTETRWGDHLISRISNALCILEPSEWYQPSQYVLWESFALGKAVVATSIGGTPDLICHEENGFMFTPGNWIEMVEQVERLRENPDTAIRVGRMARKTVEAMLAGHSFYYSLMDIYKKAIVRQGGRL